MIPSCAVQRQIKERILLIMGPTASGKSSRAVEEALIRNGEIISVDSRQVYRGLDIGTEKITHEEMRGVPHHLIDIRDPMENYSAGDFVTDATRLIKEITARGKHPILVGGTHFYFNALLHGLPQSVAANSVLRDELEKLSTEELATRVLERDPRRASELDPKNRRRLIRALEIIDSLGLVPPRKRIEVELQFVLKFDFNTTPDYEIEWLVIDPPKEELRSRIDARLASALTRGLIEEVRRVRAEIGDARLGELGLEYKVVGEFLRNDSTESVSRIGTSEGTLLPTLSAKLWQYARRQKAWLRKLQEENLISASQRRPDRS